VTDAQTPRPGPDNKPGNRGGNKTAFRDQLLTSREGGKDDVLDEGLT
jgi:hypothetical protein